MSDEVPDLDGTWHHCVHSNQELLTTLKEDVNAKALHQITLDDYEKGRMSEPLPVESISRSNVRVGLSMRANCVGSLWPLPNLQVRLVPRFPVIQGTKEDGSPKIRAVDHMSWSARLQRKRKRTRKQVVCQFGALFVPRLSLQSWQVKAESINGHCTVPEKMKHDSLDDIAAALTMFMCVVNVVCYLPCALYVRARFAIARQVPGLWKADVDAAFRRVPLAADHLWAAGVAYYCGGVIWAAFHHAMPFGATSSVYAWHRVGALLCSIARKVLHLAVYRYVDDFFAVER